MAKGKYTQEAARTWAKYLLLLKLNHTSADADGKAAKIVCLLDKGTMRPYFRSQHSRMGDSQFESYYGDKYENILQAVNVLENVEGDVEGSIACLIVIQVAQAMISSGQMTGNRNLAGNWAHLEAARIPQEIENFHSDFRGSIQKVHAIKLSDQELKIIETHGYTPELRSYKHFFVVGNGSRCHEKMEDAIFFGMMRDGLAIAVSHIYRTRNSE